MRILATLLQKEFKQIFRNRILLPIIFVVPVVQMILLTYAASLEMKGINMAVVDQDLSQASRQLVSQFAGSPFFEITMASGDYHGQFPLHRQRQPAHRQGCRRGRRAPGSPGRTGPVGGKGGRARRAVDGDHVRATAA